MEIPARPQVGVAVMILRDGNVLLGQRQGSHGAGEYGGPGGHLELGKTLEEAVLDELGEECGPNLRIKNLAKLCVVEVMRYAPKQYVEVGFSADWESGEAELMEPDKCISWGWHPMDDLPEPLMEGFGHYVTAYKTGQVFFGPEAES